jgi:hypothetical protein
VGEVGVPEPADDTQTLVDDGVVDLGLTDLGGAVDELEDDQVLRSGVRSATPNGSGLGRPARCISASA